jgi:hypothetical protein
MELLWQIQQALDLFDFSWRFLGCPCESVLLLDASGERVYIDTSNKKNNDVKHSNKKTGRI